MTHYRSLNHTRWTCQYHVVFIPKYRKKVIYAELRRSVGKAKTGGLFGRLKSHANGRRVGDQFSVYVADRFVLRLLTPERIAQISAGTLRFDELVRDYTRDRIGFRFSPTTDADSIEDAIRAGRWPHGKRPMLNPK